MLGVIWHIVIVRDSLQHVIAKQITFVIEHWLICILNRFYTWGIEINVPAKYGLRAAGTT